MRIDLPGFPLYPALCVGHRSASDLSFLQQDYLLDAGELSNRAIRSLTVIQSVWLGSVFRADRRFKNISCTYRLLG